MNYGLRYENYLPQTAASRGGAGSFDPNTGEVLVAGYGSVPHNRGVHAYNLGFAPRLGVAYQVQEHTVIRAGYGRSFTPAGLGAVFGEAPHYDPPITNPQQNVQANNYSPVFNLLNGPPVIANPPIGSNGRYPLPNSLNVYYFFNPPSSYRIPLADTWNLAVQHQFNPNLTAEVAYVGNVGRHLYINPNVNQASPPTARTNPATYSDFSSRRLYFQKFGLTQGIYATKLIEQQHKKVAVVYMTRGNSGGNAAGPERANALADIREMEARHSLASYGINNAWFLHGSSGSPTTHGFDWSLLNGKG